MGRRVLGWQSGAAAAALVMAQAGCLLSDETEGSADVRISESNLSGETTRTDVAKTIELNPGSWGSWTAYRYCPAGAFAVGYRMRVETMGHDDDTTLNALELQCMDSAGNLSTALAHDGLYGGWYDGALCPNRGFVTGGAVRYTSSRGGNDDTAANDAKLRCSTGADIVASGGIATGTWLASQTCNAGQSVCGISVRMEGSQRDEDDTALNAVRLACCPNPAASSALYVTEHTMDGIRARTFSPEAGAHQAPLLLVEGFDSDGSYTVDTLPKELPTGFLPALTRMGYSVTLVDLTKNWESLQSNAKRVGALANQLWAESARIRPLKLIGASMGGLIVTTTAALRTNPAVLGEANPGWTFQVDHVTTMDAPHAGVYIPQAIYHLLSRAHSHDDFARNMYRAVTSMATMQMLMIPYNSTFESTHAAWQNYYRLVLDVIRKSDVRFVGVVAGSWNGTTQNVGWTQGAQNVVARFRHPVIDLDAELHAQPAPGAKVARINSDPFGPFGTNDVTYYAYAGNWPIIENTAGGYTDHWQQIANSLYTNPKWPRQAFVPAWSAAGIDFLVYMGLPPAQRDNLQALEAARGPLAGSILSPFDRIIGATGDNTKHPNIPAAALPKFLDELQAAIALPGYQSQWTGWFDNDDPWTGTGDGELLGQFTGVPCQKPLTAECRRKSDGTDWKRTGDVMTCTPEGATCLNGNQPAGASCGDYEVRFACPDPVTLTTWLNRDDPSGNGDGEHLSLLVAAYGVCAQPIGIECQTTSGVDVSASGETVRCQANLGLECINASQPDAYCQDYRERFSCPTGGSWTPWLNRDGPGGNGDGEHLGVFIAENKVCPRPLAAECRRLSDGMDATLVGQRMVCNPTQGSICENANNPGGCQDYEVRFFCPGPWAAP